MNLVVGTLSSLVEDLLKKLEIELRNPPLTSNGKAVCLMMSSSKWRTKEMFQPTEVLRMRVGF